MCLVFVVLFVSLLVRSDVYAAYTASITSAGSVTINLDGSVETGTTTSNLTISTTCPAGYTVQVSGTSASNNHNLYLGGSSSGNSDVILNSAGTIASPIALATNTWGIEIGSGTYAGISSTSQNFSVASANSYSTTNDIILPVTYGARNDGTLKPGVYTMDNGSVLYTLVMDPRCIPYTLSYDGNTADAGTMDPTVYKHEYDRVGKTFLLYASNFSKTGYGFVGWGDRPLVANTAAELSTAISNGALHIYGPNETINAPLHSDLLPLNSDNKKLYAIWLAPESGVTMQTFDKDSSVYSSMPEGSVIALSDARDNSVYAIAKLADGNWWMIENLRLDLSDPNVVINSNNTNHPTQDFMTKAAAVHGSTSTWVECPDSSDPTCIDEVNFAKDNIDRSNPVSHNENTIPSQWYSYGVYYGWYTATAGNGGANVDSIFTTGGDICPAGWHIPYGNDTSTTGDRNGGYVYLDKQMGGSGTSQNTIEASNRWRAFPYNNVFSGSAGTSRGVATRGWSSTSLPSTPYVYTNVVLETVLYPGLGNGAVKSTGNTVRCLAGPSYRISYDKNSSEAIGEMNTLTYEHNYPIAGETIDLYSSNFSRPGYGFVGWSFDADATPTNGKTIYGPNASIAPSDNVFSHADRFGNIKLYAIWLQSTGDFQGWSGCSSLASGALTALTDTRDNNVYSIAKLADGNCWMIENLRFDPSENGDDIKIYNTNHPTELFMTEVDDEVGNSSTWSPCTSMNDVCYNDISYLTSDIDRNNPISHNTPGMFYQWYSFGAAYNWYTATAGNGTYSSSSNAVAAGDICPAGWKLPYGNSSTGTNGGRTSGGFYYLGVQLGATVASADSTQKWRAYPNNFIYDGQYDGDSSHSRGYHSAYWTSTAVSNFYSYYFGFSSNAVDFQIGTGNRVKSDGIAIRCVAKNSSDTFTLTYDANGGSGAPAAQTTTGNGVSSFTTSSILPTRNGYTFDRWVDKYGETTGPGGTYLVGETNTTLYAIWENNTCKPLGTTIGTNTSTDIVCLQDMNSTVKSSMNTATSSSGTYNLIDSRDGKSYTVAKLADGNVWITKNLNFAPSAETFVTSYDTDTTGFLVPASDSTFPSQGYVTPKILANDTYGAYYTYAAAIASTTAYSAEDQNITTSICPKGWDLPTAAQYDELKAAAGLTSYSAANAAPYRFIYAGYRVTTTFYSQSSAIRLWTSTNHDGAYAYFSTSYSNRAYSGNYKLYGESVRCVAANGTGTIHYFANGGTGTMSDQINVEINSTTASTCGFTAPTEHKMFRGWNTKADGTGTAVAAGVSAKAAGLTDGGTVNLYAQWDDVYIISFVNTNGGEVRPKYVVVGQSDTMSPLTAFTYSGYKLIGWDTSPDGETVVYTPGQSITPTSDMTVYTVWTPAYAVNYDANGGTGTMTGQRHTNVTEGDTFNLYAPNFIRDGYGFAGWSTNSNAQPGDGVSTIYGPNESFTAPAYNGNSTVNLYAVWVEAEAINDNPVSMQGWTGCSSLNDGAVIALTDNRDSSVYAVAKLADGNCWMIENLRLDAAGKTLSSTNTDNPTATFSNTVSGLSSSSWSTCQADTTACVNQYSVGMKNVTGTSSSPTMSNQSYRWYSYGGMYNWYTATAGNGTASTSSGVSVNDSICPAGWHLPYGGSGTGTNGGNTKGGFYYLGVQLGSGTVISGTSGSRILRSYPNNFVYSGYYYGSSASSRGSGGRYWTTTYNTMMLIADSSASFYQTGYKYYGSAVRCISDVLSSANAGDDVISDLSDSQAELSSTDSDTITYNTNDDSIVSDTQSEIAMLDTGKVVNAKIKVLSGTASSYDNPESNYQTDDSNITSIIRASSLPSGFTPADVNTISSSTSTHPIYAWYDTGTLYYYAQDNSTIALNPDSSYLFCRLVQLNSIPDSASFYTTNVTNMHGMFYMTGQNNNTDFSSAIDSWDTSNVTDMGDIFYLASEITPGL